MAVGLSRRQSVLVTVSLTLVALSFAGVWPATPPIQTVGGTSEPTATPTPTEPAQTAEQPCPKYVEFYSNTTVAVRNRKNELVSTVSLAYNLSGDVTAFFVAYENNTILGIERVFRGGRAHADGASLQLDRRLKGNHTITVHVFSDSNENSEYDRGSDRPCYHDGSRVQAGPKTFNFSSDSGENTRSPTRELEPSSPISTEYSPTIDAVEGGPVTPVSVFAFVGSIMAGVTLVLLVLRYRE